MRLGIFGGSFDPVHNAHLAIARACQQPSQARRGLVHANGHSAAEAAEAHVQPTDTEWKCFDSQSRSEPTWRVCSIEIDRGGFSYTVDTLRQIHEELPDAELFFLIGADALHDVAKWKEPREIFRMATPLVVCRAGQPVAGLRATQSTSAPKTHNHNRLRCPRWTLAVPKSVVASPLENNSMISCRMKSPNSSHNTICTVNPQASVSRQAHRRVPFLNRNLLGNWRVTRITKPKNWVEDDAQQS